MLTFYKSSIISIITKVVHALWFICSISRVTIVTIVSSEETAFAIVCVNIIPWPSKEVLIGVVVGVVCAVYTISAISAVIIVISPPIPWKPTPSKKLSLTLLKYFIILLISKLLDTYRFIWQICGFRTIALII